MIPEHPAHEFYRAVDDVVGGVKRSVEVEPEGGWPEAPPLYHYTNSRGLLGIVGSQGILASDAACLNDHSELRYVDQVLSKVGQSLEVRTEPGRLLKEQLSTGNARAAFRVGAFIASFSADPDLLSQWRAYAADGAGYAVGLPRNSQLYVLDEVPEDDEFGPREPWPAPLQQVIYDEREQQAFLEPYVRAVVSLLESYAEAVSAEDGVGAVRYAVTKVGMIAEHFAPRIKHPGFREEVEWRAVVRFPEMLYPGHRLRFRPSAHGLTASVLLQALNAEGLARLPLSELVLGPKLDSVVGSRTAKFMLRQTYNVSPESARPDAEVGPDDLVRVWSSATSYR